jgi:hypothetical protein
MAKTRIAGLLGLFAVACMASATGKGTATPSAAGAATSWCAPEKEAGLASWDAGTARMRVSYCASESTDAQGVTVFSRLDVRQQDRASGKVVWKIHDEVKPGLRQVRLFRPGFATVDVDGDGNRETFIGYYFPGEGLEPVEFKFLAHKDGKKYAIRGQLPRSQEDAAQYKAVHDPAFGIASTRFRAVSDSLFGKFITALCTDPDLGLGVPVPKTILPQ